MIEQNKVYCMDAVEFLKQIPDNSVDLILTDPPYGINQANGIQLYTKAQSKDTVKSYEGDWDNETPDKEVFDEILRVGKKVIIFGGNFFIDKLPKRHSYIVWDKVGNIKFNDTFTDVELAWTNFNRNISKKYTVIQHGFISDERNRFHPTQKPVKLFRQIILDYTKEGDTVLDCFVGSGTTAIACKQTKRNFMVCDINQKYCDITERRLAQENLLTFFQEVSPQ